MNNKKAVWITWENQRRSIVLSKEFGCELFMHDVEYKNKLIRYLDSSIKTFSYIKNKKPDIVFCQNPSLILAVLLTVFKRYFGYRLVIDRHSNFMFNMDHGLKYKIFKILSDYTIRNSYLTIVTNNHLKQFYIDRVGGNGCVLPDKIPDMSIENNEQIVSVNKKNVFFITSFSRDEPIDEFLDAINGLPDEYFFYVSGNFKKYKKELLNRGRNFELTGFIAEDKFKNILNSVDAVMVFTKNDHTLTCGAYEGVAANKPLILSSTDTIKNYFNKGAVYCDPTAVSIKNGIMSCFENYENLKNKVIDLKNNLDMSWQEQFNSIKYRIFYK